MRYSYDSVFRVVCIGTNWKSALRVRKGRDNYQIGYKEGKVLLNQSLEELENKLNNETLNIYIKLLRDCLSIFKEDKSILSYPSFHWEEDIEADEDEDSLAISSWVDEINIDEHINLEADDQKLLFIPVVGPVRQFLYLTIENVERLSIYFGGMIECQNSVIEESDQPYMLISSDYIPSIDAFYKGAFVHYLLNRKIDLFSWQPPVWEKTTGPHRSFFPVKKIF